MSVGDVMLPDAVHVPGYITLQAVRPLLPPLTTQFKQDSSEGLFKGNDGYTRNHRESYHTVHHPSHSCVVVMILSM